MSNLRIGVIGTGAIGRKHVQRINEEIAGAQVVKVADANCESAEQTAHLYNVEYVRNCDDVITARDVDAIVVTAWDPAHKEFVLKSIAAGKPVFCEKPLAQTPEDCREIIDAEMNFGRRLVQVGFMRRYDKGYLDMKKAIEEGVIGAPVMVHAVHRNRSCVDTYDDKMMVTQTLAHEIDILRWLLNDEYEKVQLLFSRKTENVPNDYLHDVQLAVFQTKKGVLAEVEVNMDSYFGYDVQCEIVGERGVIQLPDPYCMRYKKDSSAGQYICYDWEERFADTYSIELRKWIEDTKNGIVTGPNSWDGYMAAATGDAFIRSQEMGTFVKVELPERPDFYK